MKNYLLTVIGNFDSEELCQDMAISLSPIVDSPHMKFQHTKGILIFHFATEVDKSEIYDFVTGVFFGITETFILTEITDNLTVCMPKEIKSHLFDLENVSDEIDMNIDMSQVKNNAEMFGDEEEEDDFVALLLGEKNKLFKRPTLDQILDKINSKGYQSLTPFEQDVLDGYSKK
jgi:hypothetical protein